jgi:hypothetical protein
MEARIRQVRFRFDPAARENGHPVAVLDRVSEQRRLADPGLAAEDDDPTPPCARFVQQVGDASSFRTPADKHNAPV